MGSRAKAATDSAVEWQTRLGGGDYDASRHPRVCGGKKVLGVSRRKSSSLAGSVQCYQSSALG